MTKQPDTYEKTWHTAVVDEMWKHLSGPNSNYSTIFVCMYSFFSHRGREDCRYRTKWFFHITFTATVHCCPFNTQHHSDTGHTTWLDNETDSATWLAIRDYVISQISNTQDPHTNPHTLPATSYPATVDYPQNNTFPQNSNKVNQLLWVRGQLILNGESHPR